MTFRIPPTATKDTEFFWEGLKQHKLLLQRCQDCQALRHPPRPMCPRCNSVRWQAIESSGRGVVYSFVMPRHPMFPGFDAPYVVALVELDEGLRMISNLCETPEADIYIGMPVEVFYSHFDGDLVLPQFRPVTVR